LELALASVYGDQGGSWMELSEFMRHLLVGAGIEIEDLILDEVREKGRIAPEEFDELAAKLNDLQQWFRDHHVRSPLLGSS
jgi:hypothetical protein